MNVRHARTTAFKGNWANENQADKAGPYGILLALANTKSFLPVAMRGTIDGIEIGSRKTIIKTHKRVRVYKQINIFSDIFCDVSVRESKKQRRSTGGAIRFVATRSDCICSPSCSDERWAGCLNTADEALRERVATLC